jgi:pimeloyl-ACP methyl ester carboxylesterase
MSGKRVSIGDIELHVEEWGRGEPVVLLHGLGSSTRDWEYQVDALAARHRVIAIDARGHGKSDKPRGPYSIAMFADDVAKVIEKVGARPAHVIGISMGAMIGLELTARDPGSVRTLIAINSPAAVVPRTLKDRWQIFQRFAVSRAFGMRKMGEIIAGRLFPKPDQEPLRALFIERWAGNDKEAYMASLRAIVGWSVEDRLSQIRCPVLVVAGDRDYYPLEEKRKYVAKLKNGSLTLVRDSGHATPADQPAELTKILLDFLQQQAGAAEAASV